jgi:hypothetical protein
LKLIRLPVNQISPPVVKNGQMDSLKAPNLSENASTMIRFLFVASLGFISSASFSQSPSKLSPDLKQGTTMEFELNAQGQTFPMFLTISSIGAEGITFDYNFAGSMQGKFVNSRTNLEKGKTLNWDQPQPGEERKLPDEQTIVMVSSTFFADLKKNKKSTYDGAELALKEIPKGSELLIGNQQIDAVYAESSDGSIKYWILNNDQFPVILRLDGHPSGISMVCKDVKTP